MWGVCHAAAAAAAMGECVTEWAAAAARAQRVYDNPAKYALDAPLAEADITELSAEVAAFLARDDSPAVATIRMQARPRARRVRLLLGS